jgi:hypothetical protein
MEPGSFSRTQGSANAGSSGPARPCEQRPPLYPAASLARGLPGSIPRHDRAVRREIGRDLSGRNGGPAEPGGPGTRPDAGTRLPADGPDTGQPRRYLATIVEQGPGITALLDSLPAGPGLKPYLDELSVRAEAVGASSKGPAGLPPGGLLSDRELEALRLLASRLTTTEIAGALFVLPNTL